MADTFKSTFGTRIADTNTTILTAGSSPLVLKQLRLTNTSTGNVNGYVWIAPNGTTVADDDQYCFYVSMGDRDTIYIPLNDKLETSGDFISAKMNTTNVVNAVLSYIEEE